MKKFIWILLFLVAFGAGALGQERMLGEYPIDYISDPAKFVTKDQEGFPKDLERPLEFSKAILKEYLQEEVKGEFSIARATHGYQVNFTCLMHLNENGEWEPILNGFGEIFLSPDLNRIQIDRGP